jgi:hypothetical protein
VEIKCHTFLTVTLDEGEGSPSCVSIEITWPCTVPLQYILTWHYLLASFSWNKHFNLCLLGWTLTWVKIFNICIHFHCIVFGIYYFITTIKYDCIFPLYMFWSILDHLEGHTTWINC